MQKVDVVRLGNCYSSHFTFKSGARLCGVSSLVPLLVWSCFDHYLLQESNLGFYIHGVHVGCLLTVDDIIVVSERLLVTYTRDSATADKPRDRRIL